jgi:hypothetical protein
MFFKKRLTTNQILNPVRIISSKIKNNLGYNLSGPNAYFDHLEASDDFLTVISDFYQVHFPRTDLL